MHNRLRRWLALIGEDGIEAVQRQAQKTLYPDCSCGWSLVLDVDKGENLSLFRRDMPTSHRTVVLFKVGISNPVDSRREMPRHQARSGVRISRNGLTRPNV